MFRYSYSLFIFFVIVSAFYCRAQSFIDEFPKLTEENLPEFFNAWESYSDSVARNNVIDDFALAKIIEQEISLIKFDVKDDSLIKNLPKFYVVPQEINVERYKINVDTLEARKTYGLPSYLPQVEEGRYESYKVTPDLPDKALYYCDTLEKPLWEFLGGTKISGEYVETDWKNLKLIEKYLPVFHGHWGGYWWFYSLPVINAIIYYDNLIVVARRTSWHTGDLIWYVKGPDGFVRQNESLGEWIE